MTHLCQNSVPSCQNVDDDCRLVFVFNESETLHKTKFHQNKSFYDKIFINENSSKMKLSDFLFIFMVYAAQWQPNSESSSHTGTMIGNSATITLEENLLLRTQNKSKRQHRHELEKWQMWCYSLLV